MNRTKLKNYAPQARRDFIQAMTDRAAYFGLTATKTEPVVEKGDVAIIGGRSFPISVASKRKQLEDRIKRHGFEQTMEALGYTWFNRLVAIRFMELHGYLEHGYRALSHPEGKPTPEILEHAEHVELPGLRKESVIDLKLAGNKEGELYRLLLTAQCNALHTAMPFLFERIDDETELLLPDNLLNSDSLIRKLVGEIEEEDWNEVEIIGWLYQFYISEKKDEVIGKVVASEDIPAATQLFTPNWIVKYLVQNTLGRQWLATYPQSALRQQMEYYIEPAEQTPEVQEQLKAITPTSLNPEELTLLDPACGSGHILVEAYDLFKAIYQERGYRAKDIPALILQKNLFGMEIDDRAAQLAAFALMMKARADDRRIFDSEAKPNILAFEESQGMKASEIAFALNAPINKDDVPNEYLFEEIQEEKDGLFSKKALAEKDHVSQGDIAALLELFENAKTFGSLIQVPLKLAVKLPEIESRLDDVLKFGDLTHASAHVIKPLLRQARLLVQQYNAVVANPPYMGSKGLNAIIRQFATKHFAAGKSDLFAMFTLRILSFATANGNIGLMTPFVWMFLQTYAELRERLLKAHHISSLIQPEYHAFFDSAFVPICAFTIDITPVDRPATFIRLTDFYGYDEQPTRTLEAIQNPDCRWRFEITPQQFTTLPGCPIVYWLPPRTVALFDQWSRMKDFASAKVGLQTSNNHRFVRLWHEVSIDRIGFDLSSDSYQLSKKRWFPFNKGGLSRKWAGNVEHIVNWESNGREIKSYVDENGRQLSRPQNTEWYFLPGLTWSDITSSDNSFRWLPHGVIPSNVAHTAYFTDVNAAKFALGFVNSSVGVSLANAVSPTMHFSPGYFEQLPLPVHQDAQVVALVNQAIELAQKDWDSHETSWAFVGSSIPSSKMDLIASYSSYLNSCKTDRFSLQEIECKIENHFRTICGLTLAAPNEMCPTFHQPSSSEDIKRLLSYAIGCIMGRYSLDKPGLIYAHSGNQGFDSSQYKTFRADDDGIIPLLETDWGIRDDATNRFVEFISVAWPKEHLEENLKFVADSLGSNNGEQPKDTIRRYLATGFYKHHLSMYKKRPIYWLFSSGRHRAFQCFVYLHRYNEGTLARMRTEYVIPLQGQIAARIEQLEGDKSKATSTSHRKKLQKEQDDLKKQQTELFIFEEKLKHAADQKISLDLDDGVKVNYAKFGDLLAESKAICGSKDED